MRKFKYFIIFILLLLIFIIYKLQTLDKYYYVNNKDDNVEIIIIDSCQDKYSKILIKKNFVVLSSRNYGQYKIGNLWILGEKNGLKGKLVSESVLKNFSIPVYLWKNGGSTNLNLFQKIKSKLIEKSLVDYDLTLDSMNTSDSTLIKFMNPDLLNDSFKLEIFDLTGDNKLVEKITKILGIFGVKVTSYRKGYDENLDCESGGKNQKLIDLINKIFICENKMDDGGYDLRIRIGKVFADRF